MTGVSAVLLAILSTFVLVAASRFSLGRAVALARLMNVPPFVLGFVLLAVVPPERSDGRLKPALRQALWVLLGLAAVGIAARLFVHSLMVISEIFSVPAYLISFFGASIGTSLPELAVEITALRRGQKALALGDVLGSCFIDASLSLGIGPLLFPITVSAAYALKGSAVAAAAMLLIAGLLGLRHRHDLGSGLVLIAAYLLAYRLL